MAARARKSFFQMPYVSTRTDSLKCERRKKARYIDDAIDGQGTRHLDRNWKVGLVLVEECIKMLLLN